MSSASTSNSERLATSVGSDTIAGTLWHPAATPVGVVIVNPATATPERFYSTFAEYLTSRGLGYMPGKRLGIGEDLPAAAMLEWGRWARKPRYFFDDPSMGAVERAAAVDLEVLASGASDDPWASPSQMDALTRHLTSAKVERRTYSPADLGTANLGHHGLLRRKVGEAAWPKLVDWLTASE
ncbi:hypothetical protein [Gulosibacter sediminis]|uniref:hypothetical protein n=1 Tax=Gulosibacter sediminis TaxID=1729695 RepID=UPI0024AE7C72|nr:hypothetical protein [Gulosibacter sediminis]